MIDTSDEAIYTFAAAPWVYASADMAAMLLALQAERRAGWAVKVKPDAVQTLAAALWLESEGEAVERLYDTTDQSFVVEYEAKARTILPALHSDSPLGAVAMQEKAARAAEIAANAVYQSRRDRFSAGGFNAIMAAKEAAIDAIFAIPLPSPAELLAAAGEVVLAKLAEEYDGANPMNISGTWALGRIREYVALAPFARKGE